MNTLESLVPPLALCKEAAALIGNETALVWFMWEQQSGDVYGKLVPREMKDEFAGVLPAIMAVLRKDVPAPTTDEICAKIPGGAVVNYVENCVESVAYDSHGEGMHEHWCNEDWCESKTPATAALLLLMRLENKK